MNMSRCCHETGRELEFGSYASAWPVRKIGKRYEYFIQGAFLDSRVHDLYWTRMKDSPEEIPGQKRKSLKGKYLIAIKNGESDKDPSRKRSKFLEWKIGVETFPKTMKDFSNRIKYESVDRCGETIECWLPLK